MGRELGYKRPGHRRHGFHMPAIRLSLAVALALTMLSACGRKSELDTPYGAAVQARKDAERANEPVPPEPAPPAEDRPFILDRLIK
jgi:predicted small lipoprotein YifL